VNLELRTVLAGWAILGVVIVAPLGAEEPVVFFKGEIGDETLWAYSIDPHADPATVVDLGGRPDLLILVYEDYAAASSVEPSVVLAGTQVKTINEQPAREHERPTIGDLIREANVAGPKKLGAVCRDGTRPSLSGRSQLTQLLSAWKACARRGGVNRSFHTTTRDRDAVIATICEDYRLVAGDGDVCDASSPLVAVLNRSY
jgi:hypothetical protein